MKKLCVKRVIFASLCITSLFLYSVPVVYADNIIYGDADNDGIITANDSSFLMQKAFDPNFITSVEQTSPDKDFLTLDVSADKKITIKDAELVLNKVFDKNYLFQSEKIAENAANYSARVLLNGISAKKGQTIEIPVKISPGLKNNSLDIIGCILSVSYDKNILSPVQQGTDNLSEKKYASSLLENNITLTDIKTTDSTETMTIGTIIPDTLTIKPEIDLVTIKFKVSENISSDTADLDLNIIALANNENTLTENSKIYTENSNVKIN